MTDDMRNQMMDLQRQVAALMNDVLGADPHAASRHDREVAEHLAEASSALWGAWCASDVWNPVR